MPKPVVVRLKTLVYGSHKPMNSPEAGPPGCLMRTKL